MVKFKIILRSWDQIVSGVVMTLVGLLCLYLGLTTDNTLATVWYAAMFGILIVFGLTVVWTNDRYEVVLNGKKLR